ncbi:unnamed protein product [Soboliphyme baturini]|uniref:Uncharacterized protein n=1 Tax=Soboliphyme baturini TaxID=241478 RepID=A0A183IVS6_9BILA|nr:unnamed protein product [Soboliphyme baturini]
MKSRDCFVSEGSCKLISVALGAKREDEARSLACRRHRRREPQRMRRARVKDREAERLDEERTRRSAACRADGWMYGRDGRLETGGDDANGADRSMRDRDAPTAS